MSSVPIVGPIVRGASVNRRIFRAALAVTASGVLVKLVALLKEISVAGIYGRADAMDAFLMAALIPGLLVNLISESMNQALVPTLVRVRAQQGHESAQQLLSNATLCMCAMLALASGVIGLTARDIFPLIASHFYPDKLNLSVQIFYALLPVILLTGIATNCTAVLNTCEKFAWPALAPMVISLTIIASVLIFGSRLGIWALVYGSLAGALIHAVVTTCMMNAHGYRFKLHWYGMTGATREVASQYGPVLLSGVVASGGLLVDQSMAAMLPAGSVSALVYANRFVSVALMLLAGAISTAITPYFSEMIAKRDWIGCRGTLRTWLGITALVSAPVAIALIAGSHWLVQVAFQRGAFGPHDAAVVAPVLSMYAIQIPFFVSSRVFYRLLVAMRRTDVILYCGIVNLILDIVLNLVLMQWFGVAGIALATSLWTISTFFFLWYWAAKLLNRKVTG
jgi:putative peptidoglycan lipid II flippase